MLVSVQAVFAGEPDRLMLTGEWEFRQEGSEGWNKAVVPGCVHTDLLDRGLIEDPFYGRNEKSLQWIGEKDWEYRKNFVVNSDLDRENVWLVMEGIDTYAAVTLNGHLLGETDNMFRTWKWDVKDILKSGENVLTVSFTNVFITDLPKYLAAPYKLQAWPNNDQSDIWLSVYARKAGSHYGWDWGPRLITCGVWKPAYIEAWDDLRIDAVHIKTLELDSPSVKTGSARKAIMQADIDVVADRPMEAIVSIRHDGRTLCSERHALGEGDNNISCDFELKKPALWWSNGSGAQPIYEFTVEIQSGTAGASYVQRTGVRTVEVLREEDAMGRSMSLRLNGYDIFCKGANWIPIDNFPGRRGRKDYDELIGDAAEVGMNMLRVWGGGLYEHDDFYDACDSLGIMVWQDMAFACGMFPSDDAYLQNVAAEVRDNVRRLRNHPSLALWCGNNENEISYFEWGWDRTLTPQQRDHYESGLRRLFYETIPEAIAAEDATRYYHPSSPSTGHSGVPYSMGDAHMWSVWKGGWVEEYLKPQNIARFMSEYGFISYPDMFSLRRFVPEWDMYCSSPVMLAHHRAYDDTTRDPEYSNKTICRYLDRYAWVPEDFETFVYMTQWFQAEVMKVAIEAHRRAKPYCMGTLFWQLNDCWPSISWSSIDYYGRWKALQYYTRRLYAPILVSPYVAEDGTVAVKVVSDRKDDVKGEIEAYVMNFGGKVLCDWKQECAIEADACKDVLSLNPELLAGNTFLYVRLKDKGEIVAENTFFTRYPKDYELHEPRIQTEARRIDGGLELTLSTDRLVRCMYLHTDSGDDRFDDNYFTLVPGFPRKVRIYTDMTVENIYTILKYQTL